MHLHVLLVLAGKPGSGGHAFSILARGHRVHPSLGHGVDQGVRRRAWSVFGLCVLCVPCVPVRGRRVLPRGRGTRRAGGDGGRIVRAAHHAVRPAVKAGRLDGSTEGDDGKVGNAAGREVRLDRTSRPFVGLVRRFAVLVGTVDGHEETADRRVFPAAALTFRSTLPVLRSTSSALPSTVHAVKAD
jgi:hypothetical protein